MKRMKRMNPFGLWIFVLLLITIPFTQVFAQETAAEDEDEAELTLATGRAEGRILEPGRAIVTTRGNHMLVDSPAPLGGPNETYNPLDTFLTGVLTCAIFIYETAAEEMDIPLESVSGAVEADFAVQGLVDGSVNPRIRAFRVIMELEGVTAEEADLLREQYMLRCPLYTTLILAAPIDVIHVGLDDMDDEMGEDMDAEMDSEMDEEANMDVPPGPTVFMRVDLPIEDAAETLNIVHTHLAFDPGAWTPPHVHGGQTIVSILDGEITNNIFDVETTFGPGEGWQEQPDVPHMAGNDTDEDATVIVTVIMPEDAAMTTMVEGMVEGDLPPGPTLLARGDMLTADAPAEFTMVQLVLDFAPGAWTPLHTHGGDGLVTVLEGELTRTIDGVEETFGPGESWIEEAGVIHAAGNDGEDNARASVSFVLPIGAALTTVAE